MRDNSLGILYRKMTAVSLRYDFDDGETDEMVEQIIRRYLRELYPGTLGIESRNKYGETIKRHFHYNFYYPANDKETKKWVETHRRAIQRYNEKKGDDKRGKGYYSLTVQEVDDRDRWLRYPYKQYECWTDLPIVQGICPPEDFNVNIQWEIAHEEYVRDMAFLSRKREAADRRETTFQKILSLIEEEKRVFRTKESIFEFVLDYYMQNEIPVERHKIRSIIDSIALRQGVMSREEYYQTVMA